MTNSVSIRQQRLLDQLQQQGKCSAHDLARALDLTYDQVRDTLRKLEGRGQVIKKPRTTRIGYTLWMLADEDDLPTLVTPVDYTTIEDAEHEQWLAQVKANYRQRQILIAQDRRRYG